MSAAPLLLRMGGLLQRLGRSTLAASCYAKAVDVAPGEPEPSFRLGVVLQSAGDLTASRDAYTAALANGVHDVAACLRRRATVHRRLGDDEAARTDLEAAVAAKPHDRRLRILLAECAERLGRTPDALAAREHAAGLGDETPEETRRRAELRAEAGDWPGAFALYRAMVDADPENLRLRFDAAVMAQRMYRIPFRLTDDGIAVAGDDERREAHADAVELLRQAAAEPGLVRAPYRRGLLHENAGQSEEAAAAYQEAIDRAEAADRSWSELQMEVWGFRRDYALGGGDPDADDDRLAIALGESAPVADLTGTVGYLTAGLSNFGLVLKGFLLHGAADEVTVAFDGEPVVTTRVNDANWRPTFKVSVKYPVLSRLGASTTVKVTAGGRPLVTSSLADMLTITNPRGDGTFKELRASGHIINKKGHWSPPVHAAAKEPGEMVEAYAVLRDFIEERFGRRLFVMYGTLLGCRRNGRIIPGDDDFDAAYVAHGDTPEEAKRDSMAIMRACLEAGFDIGLGFEGRPFNVRIDGVSIDVNPVWFYRGKAWAFNSHALGPEHFDPPVEAELEGRTVYAPADAEAFLKENYGPDWRIPNAGFKYYRSKQTIRTIRRTQLILSEVRAVREFADRLREESPTAGAFYGWIDGGVTDEE